MINITFLIQMVNFWIAHALLSRFLLKPFVIQYYKQQRVKKGIADCLQQQEDDLRELVAEKNRSLVDFKVTMKATYTVEPIVYDEALEEAVAESIDVHDASEAVDVGAILLAKKVIDAYRT